MFQYKERKHSKRKHNSQMETRFQIKKFFQKESGIQNGNI